MWFLHNHKENPLFAGVLHNQVAILKRKQLRANMVFGTSASGSRTRRNAESRGTNSSNVGKKLSALIVDDDPIIRKVHKALLTKLGLETHMVENGKEAVDLYRTGACFDLVFMDMEMPIMDGPMATKELREMGVYTMIVGVTARGQASEKEAFMGAGLNYCYEKPLKADVVKALLEELNTY